MAFPNGSFLKTLWPKPALGLLLIKDAKFQGKGTEIWISLFSVKKTKET